MIRLRASHVNLLITGGGLSWTEIKIDVAMLRSCSLLKQPVLRVTEHFGRRNVNVHVLLPPSW